MSDNPLVLSLFPGIDLLDMAFEREGFCVVQAGKFDARAVREVLGLPFITEQP